MNSDDRNDENELKKYQNHEFRVSLPSEMIDRSKYSIWSILKQCVDKELYRFTIPIVWNEPLSMLQRLAENMKYSNELLDKAAEMTSAIERMKYVSAFLVSSTSIHNGRLSKPFNPLLGETYEFISPEKNYRICCEQVSHHPPISAYYSESTLSSKTSPKWKYYGSVLPHMKLNILNASVEAIPEGIQTVELPENEEVYTWHNFKVNAHNLVIGKLWFEHTGKTEIINHKLKIKCVLEYKPYSWFVRHMSRCEGYILDSNDNKVALLYGRWDECLFCTNNVKSPSDFHKRVEKILAMDEIDYEKIRKDKNYSDLELLWKANGQDKAYENFFNFTQFTFKLNELHSQLRERVVLDDENKISIGPLPATDSRYRPDMRLYEKGQIDEASNEKHRLEEKQREVQRKTESGELEHWKPLWFEKCLHHTAPKEETWIFNNTYWNRNYEKCPDIF
ncbi:unnamed protein product [Brachionus calyciflorus]|uniref:Oxysterol-binding protein n=1 Tax=Brachionus calyciflorus TaxID=104777 RepID=A0A813UR39_9BILA|nr:unnamed protein product [Brachionus calyciflorus]